LTEFQLPISSRGPNAHTSIIGFLGSQGKPTFQNRSSLCDFERSLYAESGAARYRRPASAAACSSA
jgi:hypothetical protein